ncbi:MAG: prephenate dehydrogenase [Neisseria sp.]|nr:prephenate dehydrogenase [Neisseria sp.]
MQTLTLIGVGLIGGSLALDLKRAGKVSHVFGVDIDADNLERALERRVIDHALPALTDEAARADVVMIATPVAAMPQVMRTLAQHTDASTVITDVGSTKQLTVRAFRDYLPQHFARCVAAHPIAGSDRSGATAARFGLFEDKKLVLCPHEAQDAAGLALIRSLWETVGAQVHVMSAAQHDRIFSAVSHLPHLLAYAFMHQIAQDGERSALLHFAASGFRDFTRIAASHPDIWADVCVANREDILAHLQDFYRELDVLRGWLQSGDRQALHDFFAAAKEARDRWQEQQS